MIAGYEIGGMASELEQEQKGKIQERLMESRLSESRRQRASGIGKEYDVN